jgi:putative transposase
MDYVRVNPVKHRFKRVADWQHSTFHRLVEEGAYPLGWPGSIDVAKAYGE